MVYLIYIGNSDNIPLGYPTLYEPGEEYEGAGRFAKRIPKYRHTLVIVMYIGLDSCLHGNSINTQSEIN